MAATAEEISGLFRAPESVDPTDLDSLGDATVAGSRLGKKRKLGEEQRSHEPSAPESGRLRLRPKVPVIPKYHGKKVDRHEVFGDEGDDPATGGGALAEEDEDADSDAAAPAGDAAMAGGGLGISGDLEAEYERMMQQTRQELQVIRAPSTQEAERREAEARQLRRQLDAWGALVELRIHLEGALALAHRLPHGAAAAALRGAEGGAGAAEAAGEAAGGARALLAELLALQRQLARQRGTPLDPSLDASDDSPGSRPESEVWAAVDGQLQSVLDWELGVADEWKERTRLDARRSFKVLDQSLAAQMQAFAEVEPAKLRRRCAPPIGRHAVLGASLIPTTASSAEKAADGGAAASEAGAEPPAEAGPEAQGAERDIFDDREFYVQLLREVLASGGKPGDAIGREDKELQAELQGRRAAKRQARAQVERRASKGRKIRYVPIEKLQNFMAPRPRMGMDGLEVAVNGHGAIDATLRALFAVGPGA